MKATINGIQIEGTPAEMVDFAEGWQTRAVGLAAFTAMAWKETPVNEPTLTVGAPITVFAAPDGSYTTDGKLASATASQPVGHVEKVNKRGVATVTLPKVKRTDAPPADAPVTKVPAGVSGKKPRAPSAKPGISSRIRYAIFNGMTQQKSLEKALGYGQQVMSARIASLLSLGHIEEVAQDEYIPGRRVFRLTELGKTHIEKDRDVLKALGKLP